MIQSKSWGEEYKATKGLKNGDLYRWPKRVPHKFRKENKTGKRLW